MTPSPRHIVEHVRNTALLVFFRILVRLGLFDATVHDSWSPPRTPEEQHRWQGRVDQLEEMQYREKLN